jgi:hypothetical protein
MESNKHNNNNNNDGNNDNSILNYLRANLTAQKTVPKSARVKEKNKTHKEICLGKASYVIIIIQFNSILYYLCAESTAARPFTETAQCRYK